MQNKKCSWCGCKLTDTFIFHCFAINPACSEECSEKHYEEQMRIDEEDEEDEVNQEE